MQLRLKDQVRKIGSFERPTSDIDLTALTQIETTLLKQTFHQVAGIQKQIQSEFIGAAANL
jgi:signal-transduction protein with cAMP-binding, CBS, and nucleotidyltransferase domain